MAPRIASSRARLVALALQASLPGATLLLPGLAQAQTPDVEPGPGNAERAQLLFSEGRALMDQNRFSEACAKFEQSQRIDPGGGTILNLGICRRREGKTATAFKVLTEALNRAHADARSDRIATAEKQLSELAPQLSRLSIVLAEGAPPDLAVELDGQPLNPSSLGQAQPLDPGVHRLSATRTGREPWTAEVTLGAFADARTITIPELRSSPPPPLAGANPQHAPSSQPATKPAPPPAPPDEKRSRSVLGYGLVSGGGVAVAAGAYFGVRAFSLRGSSNQYFDGQYCKRQSCVDDWHSAKTSATLSTVALGIGVAALGVGGYILLRPQSNTTGHASLALHFNASPTDARASASYEF